MKVANQTMVGLLVIGLAAGASACANTMHGAAKDTSKMGEKISEGAKTVDVKTALINDKSVDTSTINVDTFGDTKTVVLRGSVPTAAMKAKAEDIAHREAPGYTVKNELAVVAK
ncbi:MAG: BON domain-containing protein [Acidobacteriota bacterium]